MGPLLDLIKAAIRNGRESFRVRRYWGVILLKICHMAALIPLMVVRFSFESAHLIIDQMFSIMFRSLMNKNPTTFKRIMMIFMQPNRTLQPLELE